jgi:hypothetical protein
MGAVSRPGNSRNSPRRVKAAERQRQAMQLRIAGASFAAIARELGYAHPKGAERAIISGLRAFFREPASELLPLELERLDRMQLALWPEAIAGNVQAVMAVLRIMDRRARYMGLDAPHKVDANITSRATVDVGVRGGVLVIQGDKEAYLAGLRALRGEPAAIEGSSSVVEEEPPEEPPMDMADLPDDEPDD